MVQGAGFRERRVGSKVFGFICGRRGCSTHQSSAEQDVFTGLLMEEKVKMSFHRRAAALHRQNHPAAAAACQGGLNATQDSTHRYSCASRLGKQLLIQ